MKRNVYGTMFTCAVLASSAVLVGACSEKIEPMSVVTVNITYKDGCPKKVDRDDHFWKHFEVGKSNHIIWQASDPNARFKIYFDPFDHEPLSSKDSPTLTSPDFQNVSPAVVYKYSIVDDRCKGEPLDPRFRLR